MIVTRTKAVPLCNNWTSRHKQDSCNFTQHFWETLLSLEVCLSVKVCAEYTNSGRSSIWGNTSPATLGVDRLHSLFCKNVVYKSIQAHNHSIFKEYYTRIFLSRFSAVPCCAIFIAENHMTGVLVFFSKSVALFEILTVFPSTHIIRSDKIRIFWEYIQTQKRKKSSEYRGWIKFTNSL